MDKTSLVDEDIEVGRRFVAALEEAGLPVAAAMWFKRSSYDTWMLGIASPNVQVYGPLSVLRFAEAVRQNGFADRINRDNLFYFNTSKQALDDLASLPKTLTEGVREIWSFRLNHVDIDKALFFHLALDRRPSDVAPRPPGLKKKSLPRKRVA
ncbi:hypothetical protein [Methylobacterium pseudosasicola]|uniref:Uncharacterized protein n=1 Tax=Methylobacterium pseudosasicola TaxID=582667 RepID=A0A1I4I9Y6_9HYPH|nr:hypothetical protein [Methylobacterium pseudosasicola]SFL51085.1 hypothetical protein SAMN05192568_100617 [Methylobacterium pseudosasicola]